MNSNSQRKPEAARIATALEQLEREIHKLSAERKEAYLEAVRRAPMLIQTESPPLRFLHFSRFHVREAANGLAFYWESRWKIFGDDRAFRPLTQSGQGALDDMDVAYLKSGVFVFLPDDDAGRTVLYTDLSKRCDASPETCLRVAFYAWSVISENQHSQDDGYVAVLGLFSSELDLRFKRCEELVSVALPVHIKDTYLLCCPEATDATDSLDFFMSALPSALEAIMSLSRKREIIHLTNTKAELADKMMGCGFAKSALPANVGGALSPRNFDEWRRQRGIMEMDRYAHEKAPLMKAAPVGEQGKPFINGQGAVNPSHDGRKQLKTERSDVEKMSSSALPSSVSAAAALPNDQHTQDNSCDRDFNVDSEGHLHTDERLRQELEEAIGQILMKEKRGYLEALERAPHLVRNDPDPMTFLQCENNDVDAAARRVIGFWNLRRELFADRAFLPMDQTGFGALDQKDLEFLRAGFIQMLPQDEEGRNVLYHQRCASNPEIWNEESKSRCVFYMACVASESEVTRQYGHVLLRVVDVESFGGVSAGNAYRMYRDNFPSRPAFAHALISHDASAKKLIQATIVPAILKSFGEDANRNRFLHTGVSGCEVADKLKRHGISQRNLPTWLGGTWTEDRFRLWQEKRVALEKKRAAAIFSADTLRTPLVYKSFLGGTRPGKPSAALKNIGCDIKTPGSESGTYSSAKFSAMSTSHQHFDKHTLEACLDRDSNVYGEDCPSSNEKS